MTRASWTWRLPVAGSLIGAAILLAFGNSVTVPYLLDDEASIVDNASIRSLSSALFPPHTAGVGGRPLLNLSFALNRAIGGTAPASYHLGNLAIHLAAALTLFGIIRRTLELPGLQRRFHHRAIPVAAAAALFWALHPVQTASVTYLSQRAESLLGLCYLLTLYCFIRGADNVAETRWRWLAIGVCAAGMATKEVMITAPVAVWLYDRTFLAGSWIAAWRRRRNWYVGLGATWSLLGALMLGSQLDIRGVGFGRNFDSWSYLLVEAQAILRYLRLVCWPAGLVFDYGAEFGGTIGRAAILPAVTVAALLVGVVWALHRRPLLGFLGSWFFLILAPTSSLVPVAMQPAAENRLYLPLAAGTVGFAVFGARYAGRSFAAAALFAAGALGLATWQRNTDYSSMTALWSDTVAKVPGNARAQTNLGHALMRARRPAEALPCFQAALRLDPNHVEAHANLGATLAALGQFDAAIRESEAALRLAPRLPAAHYNIGYCLAAQGNHAAAIAPLETALAVKPDYALAHHSLGTCLLSLNRPAEAVPHFESALRLQRDLSEAENNLAGAHFRLGAYPAALSHYENIARAKPLDADIQRNLGSTLLRLDRPLEAITRYRAALRLDASSAATRAFLGFALAQAGRQAEALAELEEALRLKPDETFARETLARLKPDHPFLRP